MMVIQDNLSSDNFVPGISSLLKRVIVTRLNYDMNY